MAAISEKWLSLFRLIPEYSPVTTAKHGEWFDEEAADNVVEFFETCLKHIEGKFAGEPFTLQPWQKAFVGCLMGWKRGDNTRRYREVLLGVARGNGKTPIIGGIGNYLLFCDKEAGAQVYCAAADIQQAAILFRHARGQVEREPELEKRSDVYTSTKSIILKADENSVFKVVSSDAPGKHGLNPHAVLCDELHAWQGRELMEAFETAFAKAGRRQPLLIHLTTRDYDGRESVCNEKWAYAERVRQGLIDDSAFLPVIYAAKDNDDWTLETTWAKANPNLDVTVDRDSLRRFCEKAKVNPAKEAEFKRLHLNQKTDAANPWISLSIWDRCNTLANPEELAGLHCVAGVDLSQSRDITAVVLAFLRGGKVSILPWFWIPEAQARDREDRDGVPYRAWAKEGFVSMTPGTTIDYTYVRRKLHELKTRYDVAAIAYDPWNANYFKDELSRDGFEMVEVKQSLSMLNGPTKEFERLILSNEFEHDGNPVLRWMVSNAVTTSDTNGNIKLDKKKSTARIDGLAATVNAIAVLLSGVAATSKYEKEGLTTI